MEEYDYLEASDLGDRMLNGVSLDDDERPDIAPWKVEKILARDACPYCAKPIHRISSTHGSTGESRRLWILIACDNCAFWQYLGKRALFDSYPASIDWEVYISKARAFDEELPYGIMGEMATALRRNEKRWREFDPHKLERFVADIFRENHATCEVVHVGRPNDGGVDVLFVDSGGNNWLIQVKRRSKPGGESVQTLRNLLGVMLVEDVPRGIVVSTADHFTFRAYELQEKAANRGHRLELVDRGKLDRMLDPLIPRRPWVRVHENQDVQGRAALQHIEKRLIAKRWMTSKISPFDPW